MYLIAKPSTQQISYFAERCRRTVAHIRSIVRVHGARESGHATGQATNHVLHAESEQFCLIIPAVVDLYLKIQS